MGKKTTIIISTSEVLHRSNHTDSINDDILTILKGERINNKVSNFWYKMDGGESHE